MTKRKKHKPDNIYECPNSKDAYTLWPLVDKLENDPEFAEFFSELLKRANNNEKGAIDCVDSYFAPTDDDLEGLGIGASQWNSLRRCTESGLLVAVVAHEATGKK